MKDLTPIAAVVLAAGSSSRMGAVNKLLVGIDGAPMVRRAAGALDGLPFIERIVVTGHDADRVRAAFDGLDVRFVHNSGHAEGIASSIRTGVLALPPGIAGALIVPGDMPWIAPGDIALLLDAFDPEAGRGICIPVRGGRRGNPVLWAARHFDALSHLEGDTGGRQLFGRLAHDLHEVAAQGDGVLLDIDTGSGLAF